MAWIGGARPAAGCVFCNARDGSDDRASLVLLRGIHAFLILNAYPYAPGHLMAVTNRHVAALVDAQPEELTEAMTLVQRAVAALKAEYRAEGFVWMMTNLLSIIMMLVWLSISSAGPVNGFT